MGNIFRKTRYFDFLRDYEFIADKLDESSVKLRNSFDEMCSIIEMLLIQLEKVRKDMQHARDNASSNTSDRSIQVNDNEDNDDLGRCTYLAKYLLQKMYNSVASQKDATFTLQIEHMKCIADIFNNKLKSDEKLKDKFCLEERQEIQLEKAEFKQFDNLNQQNEELGREIVRLKRNNEKVTKQSEETINDLNNKLHSAKTRFKEMSIGNEKLKHLEKKSKETIDGLKTEVGFLKTENKRLHDNAEINVKELEIQSTSLQSQEDLRKEYENKICEIETSLQSEKEQVDTREAQMKNELEAAKRKISDMEDLQKENKDNMCELEARLQSGKEQVDAFKAKMKNELEDAERKINDMEDLRKDNENNICELEASLLLEKEQVQALKARVKNELEATKRKISDMEDLRKENEDNICELEAKLDASEAQRKQLHEKNDKLASTLRSKSEHIEQLSIQMKTITDKENHKNGLIHEMEQEKASLLAQLDQKINLTNKQSEQIESMSMELQRLERITSKQIINMQVWFNKRTVVTGGIEHEFMGALKDKFDSDHVEIRFKQCAERSDVDSEHPLMVICVAASRIGTDAANAVQGVNMSSNTALVIIHPKDSHALPHQASKWVLTSPEYQQLAGIFDIAYQSGKGVYDCNMNATSVIELVNFVEKVGVQRPMYD